MHTTAARFCKFLRVFLLLTVVPITSTAHWVVFPLASSQRCCLPQNIYICRQRMSLHSPWSWYLFHWKRNLWIFGIIRLKVHSHSELAGVVHYWGNIFLYSRISRRWGFLSISDAEIQNGCGAKQEKAVKGHPEKSILKKTDSQFGSNMGAASSSHLRETKELVGLWWAPCHHIPLGDQDRNLFLSCVICWNCSAAPCFVSSLQFLFWQTATRQELHLKVRWIFP